MKKTKERKIIFRFAPSNTGFPHIGNMYIAINNELLLKYFQSKGYDVELFLRIDDTDIDRSKDEYTNAIIEVLREFKFDFINLDNPIFQSKNINTYKKYIEILKQGDFILEVYYSPDVLNRIKFTLCNIKREEVFLDERHNEIRNMFNLNESFKSLSPDKVVDKIISMYEYFDKKFGNIENKHHSIVRKIVAYMSMHNSCSLPMIHKFFSEFNYIKDKPVIHFSYDDIVNAIIHELMPNMIYKIHDELVSVIRGEHYLSEKVSNLRDLDKPAHVFYPYGVNYGNRPNVYNAIIRLNNELFGFKSLSPKIIFFNERDEMQVTELRELPALVALRSNGYPTYNFASIIDDLELSIARNGNLFIVRGMDHLSNTPLQVSVLYALFLSTNDNNLRNHIANFLKNTRFMHLPMILNKDGHKLSKRDLNNLGVKDMLNTFDVDTIVETILKYWVIRSNVDQIKEHIDYNSALKYIDIKNISKHSPKLDMTKFNYELSQNIMYHYPSDKIQTIVKDKYGIEIPIEVIDLIRTRSHTYTDLIKFSHNFINNNHEIFSKDVLESMIKDKDVLLKCYQQFIKYLKEIKDVLDINDTDLEYRLRLINKNTPNNEFLKSLRIVVYGYSVGPSVFDIIKVFIKIKGIDRLIEVINNFIEEYLS